MLTCCRVELPNKMIPFPNEIKITHSDFCYYAAWYIFTILIKIDRVEAFFYIFVTVLCHYRLGRMV